MVFLVAGLLSASLPSLVVDVVVAMATYHMQSDERKTKIIADMGGC